MKVYNCRVRLAGLTHHEVPKFGVTEKEIIILRTVHGSDAVVGIRNAGEVTRTDTVEHRRLADFYGAELIQKTFGISLSDFSLDESDIDDEEDVVVGEPAPKQAKGKKAEPTPDPFASELE